MVEFWFLWRFVIVWLKMDENWSMVKYMSQGRLDCCLVVDFNQVLVYVKMVQLRVDYVGCGVFVVLCVNFRRDFVEFVCMKVNLQVEMYKQVILCNNFYVFFFSCWLFV